MTDTRSRFGLFGLVVCAAAALAGLIVSAVLQRLGLAQPYAVSIAAPCGFLVLFPLMRRWSQGSLRLSTWVAVAFLFGAFGLLFDRVLAHL